MNYDEKIKKHLILYKKENKEFPKEKGCWRGKLYDHILVEPKTNGTLNLISIYRDKFLLYLRQKDNKIKFHQCFHHLNSSQAMCINFFFPLFKEKELKIILHTLGFCNEEVDYDTVEFEKTSDKDNRDGETATSFDFYLKTKSGKQLFFEIKYTENCFGISNKDKSNPNKYLDKYEQVYKKEARKTIKQEYATCDSFLENYQLMRNLIHVSRNSYVVFIVPKGNETTYKQASNAKNLVLDEYKDHVKVLPWEKLYDVIAEQDYDGILNKHFEEFKKKYKL